MDNKKKIKYVDDGRTIYNMNVDGMPNRRAQRNDKSLKEGLTLSKEERRSMIKAALAHYLPIVFGVIICFLIAMIIIFFWLS